MTGNYGGVHVQMLAWCHADPSKRPKDRRPVGIIAVVGIFSFWPLQFVGRRP